MKIPPKTIIGTVGSRICIFAPERAVERGFVINGTAMPAIVNIAPKITKNAVALSDEDELKKILAHAYVLSKGNENLNSYLDETKNGYIELMANAMVQNFHKGEANTSDFKDGYKRFIKMGLYYITSAKQGAIWGINTSTAGSETFFNLAGHWKRRIC